MAYGFTMNSAVYYPIAFEERICFGLVPADAVGLTPENTYRITTGDLGEVMGTVEARMDDSMIGRTAYHFAAYPDSDAICIVDMDKEGVYAFYVAEGISISDEIGENFDRVLEAYGMPEAVIRLEVGTGTGETMLTITDPEIIRTFECYGFYILSEEEAAEMNTLLNVPES